ncbi:MAG: adenosylmethionine-8-amino-7-oxononanoate aminotransferase, partial [Urechidicola sp.]
MPENSSFSEEDLAFDRDHIWHPYTSLSEPLPTYPISAANGVHLIMDDGTKLIDGMASWWTAIHGYNHPELNNAAKDQLDKMSHVMFGGITHQPAISLAKKLVEITPKGLDKVFFADSGSVAVEVAMKMAIQYHQAKGNTSKSKFLTVKFGYHGDTTGAMSVCDPVSGMHHIFKDFIPQHLFAPPFKNGFSIERNQNDLTELEEIFRDNERDIAAFIIEPIVQGAGGMRIYSPDYLKLVEGLCEKHDVLFI